MRGKECPVELPAATGFWDLVATQEVRVKIIYHCVSLRVWKLIESGVLTFKVLTVHMI